MIATHLVVTEMYHFPCMAPAPQLMFHCVAMEEEAWLLYSGVYHLKGLGRQTGGLATEISAASIQTSGLGTCESRNAERGTERGTEVNCGPRAIITVRAGRLYLLDWTGLTQKSVRCLFQCRTEAKYTYLFAKVACIACFRVFPRVGRGQRSRAYLMSSSKMRFSQSWMIVEYYFLFSMLQQKAGVRCLR